MPPVIQLTRRAAVRDDADLAVLQRTFAQQHCARLSGLLEPALLVEIRFHIERGEFREFAHGAIATEQRLEPGIGSGLLHFLVNDPRLFRLVQDVSGCTGIGAFAGRVYRRFPGDRHYDHWHSDTHDARRLIGMSVNLSADVYEGGVFEIRDVESERPIASLPNVGVGDAILFRLTDALEHRVSNVSGRFPKTAFAGWFHAGLDYDKLLHDPDAA